MLLPRGVTGICGRKEGPHSFSDYREFRAHCYTAARVVGGAIRGILTPRPPMFSYALALIDLNDITIALVLNEVFPLLAFAVPPGDSQTKLDFADCPDLATEFEDFGVYTVLLAASLSQPLTREMCRDLAAHEQNRIQYFRPRRVGDVIYNFWD